MAEQAPVAAEATKPLPLAKARRRLEAPIRAAGVAKGRATKAANAAARADAEAAEAAEREAQAEAERQATPWQTVFLKAYAKTGHLVKSAQLAGVTRKDVKRQAEESPAFAEGMADAISEFCESLEAILADLGFRKNNPLALFGLLKRHDPTNWNDKLVLEGTLKHKIEQPPLPLEELNILLAQMAAAGQRLALSDPNVIDAEVIDVRPVEPAQQQPTFDPDVAALAARMTRQGSSEPVGGQH